jgi:hypothetical protein
VLLATHGYIGIKPQVLKRLHGRFTIVAIVQGRRDGSLSLVAGL